MPRCNSNRGLCMITGTSVSWQMAAEYHMNGDHVQFSNPMYDHVTTPAKEPMAAQEYVAGDITFKDGLV